MNDKPVISVIVPYCNNESTIMRCINSILAQSFQDFELILVNDGSGDDSARLIGESYGNDERIKTVYQNNRGVSAARNVGIECAIGEYIAFCDADDYIGDGWLFSLLSESKGCDLVFANYTNVDENGGIIKKTEFQSRRFQLNSNLDYLDFIIRQVFQKGCSWTVWSCLFRKNIIDEHAIRFNEECENFGEDLGFVLEYILHSQYISIIKENSYYYVTHSGSMSDRSNNLIRMNSMNEVSKRFCHHCIQTKCGISEKYLSVVHFLIMYGQYHKVITGNRYPYLKTEIEKIHDQEYYCRMTKALMKAYKEICRYTDKRTAKQILLLTNYCIHRNWKRFKIESAVFYWIVKH